MNDSIAKFFFRGMMAREAVRNMASDGVLRIPLAPLRERKELDLFAPVPEKIRAGSAEMQWCYRLLFVFENSARDFISETLQEVDGDTWFDTRANADMKRRFEERKQKEESNQWHQGRNRHPIYYLDFGHLNLLIINHWQVFESFFPNQAWVTSRMQEAERSRNVIAHTNVLAAEEVDRLEMYLRDWLKQVG